MVKFSRYAEQYAEIIYQLAIQFLRDVLKWHAENYVQ